MDKTAYRLTATHAGESEVALRAEQWEYSEFGGYGMEGEDAEDAEDPESWEYAQRSENDDRDDWDVPEPADHTGADRESAMESEPPCDLVEQPIAVSCLDSLSRGVAAIASSGSAEGAHQTETKIVQEAFFTFDPHRRTSVYCGSAKVFVLGNHRSRLVAESFELTERCGSPPRFRELPVAKAEPGPKYPRWAKRYSIALQVIDLHWLWSHRRDQLRPRDPICRRFVISKVFSLRHAVEIAKMRKTPEYKCRDLGVPEQLQFELVWLKTKSIRERDHAIVREWGKIEALMSHHAQATDYEICHWCLKVCDGNAAQAARQYALVVGEQIDRRRMDERKKAMQRAAPNIRWERG